MPDAKRAREEAQRAREVEILGEPPRVPALQARELSSDLLQLLTRMIAVNASVDAREPEMLTELLAQHEAGAPSDAVAALVAELPEIMLTMVRHPDLFAKQAEMALQLLAQGALPARDRELLILRVAWLSQAPYEWGEHVHIAKAAGLRAEEVERITQGSTAPGWSEHDRALLSAVDELLSNAMISDATWAVLAQRFDERQLIELPIVIGQYQTTAYYQNALRLRLHPGNPGLSAR